MYNGFNSPLISDRARKFRGMQMNNEEKRINKELLKEANEVIG